MSVNLLAMQAFLETNKIADHEWIPLKKNMGKI